MVMSSFLAGAEMMTFSAPASTCAVALVASVNRPVDSMTISRAELLPRDVARVALGRDLDLAAVDDERLLARFDVARDSGRSCCRT